MVGKEIKHEFLYASKKVCEYSLKFVCWPLAMVDLD